MTMTAESTPKARRGVPGRLIALGVLVIASATLCLVALLQGWIRPQTLQEVVGRAGSWAMLAYIFAVIVMEILWLPRMWGLFAGGALFGPWLGGGLSLVADLGGALVCYLLARGAGRQWVAQLLGRRPRAKRVIDLLADRRGTLTIAVLRICPVAHYTAVSYAAGLAGVRPAPFTLGTALGIVPGAVLYPIVGDAMLRPTSPAFVVSVAVLVIALAVTVVAARRVLRDPSPSLSDGP